MRVKGTASTHLRHSAGYMAHLKASRAFFSPHSSEAMAEALGAERAYEGLSGSLLMPGMNNPQELRQHLKQLIDRSWSDEALRHGVSYATAGNGLVMALSVVSWELVAWGIVDASPLRLPLLTSYKQRAHCRTLHWA